MNDRLLTVKEVADMTGLTTQNIYQQLESNLKSYIVTLGKQKRLKSEVITEYYKIDLPSNFNNYQATCQVEESPLTKPVKPFTNLTSENESEPKVKSSFYEQYIIDELARKDKMIKEKDDIIIEKDKIIQELINKITEQMDNTNELANRIATLFEHSQQLQQNQQLLEAQTMKAEESEYKDKPPKQGFFKRIFNKK